MCGVANCYEALLLRGNRNDSKPISTSIPRQSFHHDHHTRINFQLLSPASTVSFVRDNHIQRLVASIILSKSLSIGSEQESIARPGG